MRYNTKILWSSAVNLHTLLTHKKTHRKPTTFKTDNFLVVTKFITDIYNHDYYKH